MPVHNTLPYLDQAVESILAQTFTDFEFVILDDGSTDGSTERLREWARKDKRIRLIEIAENLGPALSSDRVARAASAPIVARMDGDDLSYPERLAEQVAVLDERPDVGVIGSLFDIIDHNGRLIRKAEPWHLVNGAAFPPFGNGPMTYRREVFEKAGGFRKVCEFWEDRDLLVRMSAVSRIMVFPHALYQIRLSRTSTRLVSEPSGVELALDLMYRAHDCLRVGYDYEHLLSRPRRANDKLDPRVFVARGSTVLWSGSRPRLFRRLLRQGDLSLNIRSLAALAWVAWASASPGSLRVFFRLIILIRNLYASATVQSGRPFYWSPTGLRPVVPATEIAPPT